MTHDASDETVVDVHLAIRCHDGTLTGTIVTPGTTPKSFTGWIALNAAIEDLLPRGPGALDPPGHDAL